VWEILIILNDPLIHVTGDGAHTPTVFVVFDLALLL
jgi:hypothetical protein